MRNRYRDLESVTKDLIRLYGVKVRKRLSQHFVVDYGLLDEILQYVTELKPTKIVEIGTGLGILTAFLSSSSRYVITVELDNSLAKAARDYLSKEACVDFVETLVGDGVLLVKSALRDPDVIASNVPYSITGPLINSIIKSNCRAAVLTIQKEVAERLVAVPGSKPYSRLTVMVNTFMTVQLGGIYPPTSFIPHPKVYSRVVVLRRLREWNHNWRTYEEFVRCLFNQKRKLAKKVLKSCLGEDLINKLNVELGTLIEGRRVYQLPVETIIKIYSTLRNDYFK